MEVELPMEFFPEIKGSLTSKDGRAIFFKVERGDGSEIMIGFPHSEMPAMLDHIAVQAAHAKNEDSKPARSAFRTKSFALGTTPDGLAFLMLQFGEVGAINFMLPGDMPDQLHELLGEFLATRPKGKTVN